MLELHVHEQRRRIELGAVDARYLLRETFMLGT